MKKIACAEIRARIAAHTGCVVLGDTSDYEVYFWLAPFTAPELEEWWREQTTFEFETEDELVLAEVFGEPPRTKFRTEPIPGERLWATSEASWKLWEELSDSRTRCKMRLCFDCDSYLKMTDGRVIFHQGCTTSPEAAAEEGAAADSRISG